MNHLISRDPYACFTQIDDEIILLNPVDQNFYHLNESAVDLWLSLSVPKTVLELAQVLAEKYLGLPDAYQEDVIQWVDETRQKGFLVANEPHPN